MISSACARPTRQPLGAAASREESEADLRLTEHGEFAGEPQVTGQQKLAANPACAAADRRDTHVGELG
jgi:hypothetical protein